MTQLLEQRLNLIRDHNLKSYLAQPSTGLEKESLRVSEEGRIAQTPHPKVLGSKLTHSTITTDYSESLLELITPPHHKALDAYNYLLDVESFIYQHLDNEILWTTSMPCVIGGEDDVRIAEYGDSNIGKMKHVYRQGLAWRYGKVMQVIAGVHFNYSIDENFWEPWRNLENPEGLDDRAFRDHHYMNQIRNMQRYGWLIIYLFGSSPAICKTFLQGYQAQANFSKFNENTLYEKYGTSLRMGNIGYTNANTKEESKKGVNVCYNSLGRYIEGLREAINTPYEPYAKLGIKVNGEYRQLNDHVLQIENEYYSTVRPKQPMQGLEKPTDALAARGIRYVELRSVDINAFDPAGLSPRQLAFLEVFMHFCMLNDSPSFDCEMSKRMIDDNQITVAHRGREPNLKLQRPEGDITLKDWGLELMEQMQGVAELLDEIHATDTYTCALSRQKELIVDPSLTPSARVLGEMMSHHGGFFDFAHHKAEQHRDFFLNRTLSTEQIRGFENMATESFQQQAQIEASDALDFDSFLQKYFQGTLS